jgi:hypothetical protein
MRFSWVALAVFLSGCATDANDGGNASEFSPRSAGAGVTLVSDAPEIAADFGALRTLAASTLPDAASAAIKHDVASNDIGEPRLHETRLLLAVGGKSLYAVPTTDGSLCAVLSPPDISVCNGLHNAAPRVYPYYEYSGWPRGADNYVLFGLVPDRVRAVHVLMNCKPEPALTSNGGFLYEERAERRHTFDGFVFQFRDGTNTGREHARGECARS